MIIVRLVVSATCEGELKLDCIALLERARCGRKEYMRLALP